MSIVKPPKLSPGDTVGIISPSEPIIYRKKFERGVDTLEQMGFRVALGRHAFKEYGAYLAGRDSERVADLNAMFRNPRVKAIFCSRGGMNSNRYLGEIDFRAVKKQPKILMGFSDVTVLLNAIHLKTGLVTFHGQNVEFGFSRGFSDENRYTLEYFAKAVMSPEPVGPVRRWRSLEVLKRGKAEGRLVGGNLTALMTLIGTEYEPDWRQKIFFWEEASETTEHIDHYLAHLRLAGVFDKISGMVIGKLVDCDILRADDDWNKEKAFPMDRIVLELCRKYKFPIIKGIAFGHYYPQITLPIGVNTSIDTGKELPFSIDEAGVE